MNITSATVLAALAATSTLVSSCRNGVSCPATASGLAPDSAEARYHSLARTPPVGWNSWNVFKGNIDEGKIRAIADAMVASGIIDLDVAGVDCLILECDRDRKSTRLNSSHRT